jgi:hypothetical protein
LKSQNKVFIIYKLEITFLNNTDVELDFGGTIMCRLAQRKLQKSRKKHAAQNKGVFALINKTRENSVPLWQSQK